MAELGQKYVPSMFTGIVETMGSVEKKVVKRYKYQFLDIIFPV